MKRNTYNQYYKDFKRISFQSLLKEKQLKLGYVKDRSYGHILMAFIDKYKNKANTFLYEGQSFSTGLIKMMYADRIDYIIEYPWVAAYYRSRISGKNDELVSLQIEELKDNQYIVAGVACTKNAWGKTIIYNF